MPTTRRSALRALVGTVVVALLAAGTLAYAAPANRPVVGSSRGTDPYFPLDGNRGYQVEHYRIVDSYDIPRGHLVGATTLRLTATRDLAAFHLDLALRPTGVWVRGAKARFRKVNPHELRVRPGRPVLQGQTVRVRVRYAGYPASVVAAGVQPFLASDAEGLAIGEPQIGPWWFAANETPTDKATYDIVLRVPEGRQAVSNGELVAKRGVTIGGRRWTSWRWRMSDPMLTYLAFFAAGRFDLERGTSAGRPFVYAVSRALGGTAQSASMALLRETPEVIGWLEGHFGPYPFTSIGGVVTSLPSSFALENQSRPVYPYSGGPAESRWLVVHEQAHQWFGDSVSLRRWRDVWLNEGPATYAEWLYDEEHGGLSVQDRLMWEYAVNGGSFWSVRVGDPGPQSMWSDAVYVRGAMTIAALRNRIGDEAMSTLLRRWAQGRAGGHGTRAQFEVLAEEVGGEDLDGFFTHWLDDTTRPAATAENGLA